MRKKESVRWDCEKVRERERESQTLLLTADVNTICVKGWNWPFLTSYGCIWYFLKPQVSLP